MSNVITVITPVYNMSKYLDTCIQSILNQTYKDFELLLINDGSTDESGKICDKYVELDARVRVIHTRNQGQDMARNTALMNVHTEYVAMIDSDDCVNCHFLEHLMITMQDNDADMVVGGFKDFVNDQDIDYLEDVSLKDKEVTIFTQKEMLEEICIKYHRCLVTPQKLYKTKVFQGVTYPPVGVNIDEWTIHHLVLNSEKVVFLKSDLYYYRLSPEGMTRNFSAKKISGVQAMHDRIKTLDTPEYRYLLPYLYFRFHMQAMTFYLKCYEAGIEAKKLIKPFRQELQYAFQISIKHRKDLYSRKEMLARWLFTQNLFLFDIFRKVFSVQL